MNDHKIDQHPKRKQIIRAIIEGRQKGVSWRDLSTEILEISKLEISHSNLPKYYKGVLHGDIWQDALSVTDAETPGGYPQANELLQPLRKETTIDSLKSTVLGLMAQNMKDHIANGERLKPEYAEYLKKIDTVSIQEIEE